jgi:hypothetical protein
VQQRPAGPLTRAEGTWKAFDSYLPPGSAIGGPLGRQTKLRTPDLNLVAGAHPPCGLESIRIMFSSKFWLPLPRCGGAAERGRSAWSKGSAHAPSFSGLRGSKSQRTTLWLAVVVGAEGRGPPVPRKCRPAIPAVACALVGTCWPPSTWSPPRNQPSRPCAMTKITAAEDSGFGKALVGKVLPQARTRPPPTSTQAPACYGPGGCEFALRPSLYSTHPC